MKKAVKLLKNPTILLIIGIFISLSILGVRVVLQEDKFVTVEIIASGGNWWETIPKVPDWLGDAISPGAIEYSAGNKKLVEVLEVRRYDEEQNRILWIKVKLLVTPDKNSGGWRFRQMPLNIGSTLTIEPNSVKLVGSIIAIEGSGRAEEYRYIMITVRLYDEFPWYADAIKPGDKYIGDQDRIIAEILDKKVEFAETVVNTADGRVLERRNPLKKDITLTLKIEVADRNGTFYFNHVQPVKIGNILWVPTDRININEAKIIGIEEIQENR
jgi:hypothetical protein